MHLIEDIIETLSDEEREFHRDLITECRRREGEVIDSGKKTSRNMKRMTDAINNIMEDLTIIHKNTREIEKEAMELRSNFYAIMLGSIPDDDYYKV